MIQRTVTVVVLMAALCGSAAAYDCSSTKHKEARERIVFAIESGIIQPIPGGGSRAILLNDVFWSRLTFPQKQIFADELVCAAAGEGKGLRSIQIRSLMTGKPLGDWNMGTLTLP